MQAVQGNGETNKSQLDCTKAYNQSATVNRSVENTSIVNSLQENDIFEKLTPDDKHQEFNDTSDHPKGTDITKLNDTSGHRKGTDIIKFKDTSDNTKDTDSKMVENESGKPTGTDLEHTKSNYGTTEYTQRYDFETKG
ncbi:hypothetical protein scyTo_0012044 [Scyliorhinus torazame]|uniref:Uncharacterized protein n=1 Tax=Scyliorhinus torazame TaxID=75743 RepID=A0A401P0N9_SCYTO|nr:hypothetical protein [Scyliorhinus torazame]